MKTIYQYTAILLLFLLLPSSVDAGEYRAICDTLKVAISEREANFEKQLQAIAQEKERLSQASDLHERFNISYNIFTLSRAYQYDIAYKYANESLVLAEEIDDSDLIGLATAAKISTFTSGGLFTEAGDLLRDANTSLMSDKVKRNFYYEAVRYFSDRRDYASQLKYKNRYGEELREYADSILMLSPTKDYLYYYALASKAWSLGEKNEEIELLEEFHRSGMGSDHHKAIMSYMLGSVYFESKRPEDGFKYLIKSVQCDISAAVRENRSVKTIAQHLFERGEVTFAETLINIALEDANFYGARHRNLEISTLLPIINQHKIASIRLQRNIVYGFSFIVTLLSVIAVIFGVLARRNAKKIKQSKSIIQQQLHAITTINHNLMESNSIKEHYIVESLCKKSEYIKQMETLLKKIDVKVKNRLYDDLRFLYKDFNTKREREDFFADFDSAFLNLFPDFIDEYNQLFDVEDRVVLTEGGNLPTEVRIFALMRVGITDNERISKFLDLSINTIYAYKTKVKNKTIVPKDEFESRVNNIKLT